jgi:hypothetical protein
MSKGCKSCNNILYVEPLLADKLGYELKVCIPCITSALRELGKEHSELHNDMIHSP